MYSPLVPFENIIDAVKDATGISNLRNLYPTVRRYVYRAEKEIGFGKGLILKRIKYSTSNNTIVNGRLRLPDDIISIEEIGMCQEGVCPGDYKIQGNWIFLCKPITDFNFIYYTMMCDGEGNPAVTENHFEAVVSGVKFFMYQPKIWNNEGNLNFYKDLEKYYDDRIGEARGDDLMPTQAEWAKIGQKFKMSSRDILIYSEKERCYCCIEESENDQVLNNDGEMGQQIVYFWQYSDLVSNISIASEIDQSFLDSKSKKPLSEFSSGYTIPYVSIGRIAFAVSGVKKDSCVITDIFNKDITDTLFDSYYNEDLKMQIYVSKEYYSYGNIFFQLTLI